MKRSALACLVVLAVAACSDSNLAPSDPAVPPGISFQISDGNHGGSPGFYFLPPMVSSPGNVSGTFNPNASPTVSICQRDATNTTCVGTPTVFTNVPVQGQHYQQNWKIPSNAAANTIFRVSVLVDGNEVGFADVKLAKDVDTDEFVSGKAGANLAIKFLIQTHCTTSPCSEGTIGPLGGTVFFTDGGETIGGVHIDATGRTFSVKIEYCPAGELGTDLPEFGDCLFVVVRDANGEVIRDNENDVDNQLADDDLGNVFVCTAEAAVGSLPEGQEELVTLHRKHNGQVWALAHDEDFCPEEVGSFGGFFRALVQGHFQRAGRQLAGALAPKPLYARRLDEGGGGKTDEFSFFRFALPSKMEIQSGNGQSGEWGSTLFSELRVLVTDLNDQPVQNARVHFSTDDGSVSPTEVLTNASGIAMASWTLPDETDNPVHARAFGFGIASPLQCEGEEEVCTEKDGPRATFDPFIPCFDEEVCAPPEAYGPQQLETGELFFEAFGFSCDGPCETGSFVGDLRATSVKPTDLIVGPVPSKRAAQSLRGAAPVAPTGRGVSKPRGAKPKQ